MIEIFKHFHSYENCTLLKISDLENVLVENTTTNCYGKHPKMARVDSKQTFSTSERSKTWNELPKKIVHAKSIDSFKNKIDEAWKDLPVKFYEQERFIEA